MSDPGQPPSAGWKPDPERPDTWRYWDGSAWTDQRAPMAKPGPGGTRSTHPALGVISIAAACLLAVLVVGSIYNGQFGFALLWAAILAGLLYFRHLRQKPPT